MSRQQRDKGEGKVDTRFVDFERNTYHLFSLQSRSGQEGVQFRDSCVRREIRSAGFRQRKLAFMSSIDY